MKRIEALVIACSLLTACGSDRSDPTVTVAEEAPVVRQYAVNLDANYQDVIAHLEALQVQTSDFLAGPSDSGLAT